MKTYNVPEYTIETLVDGWRDFLKVNLIANSALVQDAHKGDTQIVVANNGRFWKFDTIVIMDNNAKYDPDQGQYTGLEFHTISDDITETGVINLIKPLEKDYLVADYGRMQKAIKNTFLQEKDILYGDRAVIAFDQVAVCVEPETRSNEWLALQGLLGNEYRMAIIVYVKAGGLGEEEEIAMRICNAYADVINKLAAENIHLDLSVDETPLVCDGCAGASFVYIAKSIAHLWPPDRCMNYEVQDNFHAQQLLYIVDPDPGSSSTSQSSCETCTSGSSSSSSLNSSSSSPSSVNSSSSSSSSSSESSSFSTQTDSGSSKSSSLSSEGISSSSSSSSLMTGKHKILISAPLWRTMHVSDHAVLRRKKRYMYDSRVDNAEYGTVQKGSVFLKAGRLSWFGKETWKEWFPQVNKGRGT